MKADSYKNAVLLRQKTPDEIHAEMDDPKSANFSLYDYHMPNGTILGVGKSKIRDHASMYQIKVVDFDGKPNVSIPLQYAGEYTTAGRAENDLLKYCKEAWAEAEERQTKQVRKAHAGKVDAAVAAV